jgi:hypothetical protein
MLQAARAEQPKERNGVPIYQVKVQNVETPGAPIEFTIGPKTMQSYPEGVCISMADGGAYDLPVDIVEHLNSLATPIMAWVYLRGEETDAMSGEPKEGWVSRRVGSKNRFAVTPVHLGPLPNVGEIDEQLATMRAQVDALQKRNQELEEKLSGMDAMPSTMPEPQMGPPPGRGRKGK